MPQPASPSWHALPADECVRRLSTDADRGLSAAEAASRLERHGPNELTPRRGHGPLMLFLLQFHQPLVYVLLAAAAVTGVLQEWVDSGVILGVVLVNAVVGFIQEYKAAKAIEALARTMTAEATVVRGGQKRRIPAAGLVPGDLVLLAAGDRVPADLRLVRVRDLQAAEAALTGESVPVAKSAEASPADAPLADRHGVAYASTLVTYGTAAGVVVETGDRTEVGRISQLIAGADDLATPLTRTIARFSRQLLYAILVLAGLTFAAGLMHGRPAVETFMAAVALAVAAIPEGLPAAVTIVLAIGVWRMSQRKAIIRKLPAVETLGSTTVICSDKTGTLTENQMTVQRVAAGGEVLEVEGGGYAPVGGFRRAGADAAADLSPAARECLAAGVLCNDSVLAEKDGRWEIHGDPTEGALLTAAAKAGLAAADLNAARPRLDAVPFESQHQYMATLHDEGPGRPRTVYVKGAVEAVLDRCADAAAADGSPTELDREAVLRTVAELAGQGLRVLAFARKTMPAEAGTLGHDDVRAGLTLLGLQAMIDPPRAAAIGAVAQCRTAGVRVKMITGDHAATASAIAARLGMETGDGGGPAVVTGRELAAMDDSALADAAERTAVFARVSPEQKLRLVRALQGRGHVAAMTGDGVNDAPALRQANIGVAMGVTGTDVAKEAADMVLTDDDFASIVAAVEEGRGVFDNLTKFLVWTLPTNLGEGLVILTAIFTGAVLPILPVQILWINMTTAVLLGLMLTFEPKEPDLMTRRPRDPKAPIIGWEWSRRMMLVAVVMLLGAFGLFQWEIADGAGEARARTTAVAVFVVVEAAYLFNCRSLRRSAFASGLFSNPWVPAGVAAMITLQLAFTYVPVMNTLFDSTPMTVGDWLRVLAVAAAAFVLVEIEKAFGGREPPPSRP